MNLQHSQRNAAFDGIVGALAMAVISVLCITFGGCTSHATTASGVPVLHARATLPAQSRLAPPEAGDEMPFTPMETVGASPMN